MHTFAPTQRHFPLMLLALVLLPVGIFACSDRGGDEVLVAEEFRHEQDVGVDVDEASPAAVTTATEPVAFEDAEPGEPARTLITASHKRGIIAERPPLPAQTYLPADRARAFLKTADIETSAIAGQKPSSTYNSIRYSPVDTPQQFGLGLQIWRLEERNTATSRLSQLRAQFLNVAAVDYDEAPRASFTSERAGIRTFVFASPDESHIFALSCGLESCPDWTPIYELGLELAERD